MSIATDQLELDAVNSAIERVLTGGQQGVLGTASLTMPQLDVLYKRKDVLQKRIDRASNGGIRVRGGTPV